MIYVPDPDTPDPWYVQCRYEAPTETGKRVGTSWLPESLAVVGKRIYFGEKTDSPSELWTVTDVFGRERWSTLRGRASEYRHWRGHAGIPGVFRLSRKKRPRFT
jgi:hypothetical protein